MQKDMGTYVITWKDVCEKHCSPTWHAYAKRAGDIKIKVEPGEVCKVKVV